jgi:uroporphyrin-III C-methyltransferase
VAAGLSSETAVLVAVDVSLPREWLVHGRLSAPSFLAEALSDDSPTLLSIGEATRGSPCTRHVGSERLSDRELS